MERDGDPGPDAASIRPVSSLRAKFENLQTQTQRRGDAGQKNNASATATTSVTPSTTTTLPKPSHPIKQSTLVRSSLDLPRSTSSWSSSATPIATSTLPFLHTASPAAVDARSNEVGDIPDAPPTSGDRLTADRAADSPTRLAHKRPLSMHIQHSPRMTPTVHIHSPRSPPPGSLNHTPSHSPERPAVFRRPNRSDDAAVPKNTNRSPNRVMTSVVENVNSSSNQFSGNSASPAPSRARSPIPPVINRADKPKIPAKPSNVPLGTTETNLGARPLAFLNGRKISPFSTPPSSDEERIPSPDLPISNSRPSSRLPANSNYSSSASDSVESIEQRQSRDPRSMGFSAPKPPINARPDPRHLGFSQTPPTHERARSRSNLDQSPPRPILPSRTTVPDPRTSGFSSQRPEAKVPAVSTTTTTSSSSSSSSNDRGSLPPRAPPQLQTRVAAVRDPRAMGFSTAPSTPIMPIKADNPTPLTPRIPPPRPSEDSKRPAYTPAISRATSQSRPATSNPTTPRRSVDGPRPAQVAQAAVHTAFPPPPKRSTFNEAQDNEVDPTKLDAPALPRRRSFDTRPPDPDDSDEAEQATPEPITTRQDYPDASHSNRRPPLISRDRWQVNAKTDGKAFDLCGKRLCIGGYHTKVFNTSSSEEIVHINHGETVKTTSVMFKPGADIKSEGKRIWAGNNIGDILEIDLETSVTMAHSTAHGRVEIHKILRHHRDIWSLDEAGKLFVWPADESGVPNLKYSHISHKLLAKPNYAMVVQDTLWVATGKDLRVYRPGHDSTFNVSKGVLPTASNTGDVTCGTYTDAGNGKVFVGHADGKVSMYSLKDYSSIGSVKVSDYKINSLAVVGDSLWAVFKTGKVYVYDTSTTPWKVRKDWKAHEGPATSIVLDPSSVWLLGRLQVATTGHDGYVRLWDGMLEEDWLESHLQARSEEYCTFRDVQAAVTTWNAGAVSPAMLKTHFIADAIHAAAPDPPEILVFGFQEVVDLEDKSVTAKSLLGFGKKKESRAADNQQYQSRVYRDWRDYLARCIGQYLPQHDYVELHTSSLVGLFSCIFVRANEKRNITKDARKEVKCGMGGHYGNKGALLCRFVLDSSSLCFVNCHLAAGQSHTAHRNNDVATILESDGLPPEADLDLRTSLFVGGGDGRQILDHEICILNGDLNYRIDTLPRATVIKHVANNNLTELLKRDQLNVSRHRVAGFRLAPFTELPITFPPTYKYDVGTDEYDSSDKKRSPAWCDRILFRAPTAAGTCRAKQLEYIRHEGVRYSDHRPVSGLFSITVKKVDEARRKQTLKAAYAKFEKMRKTMLEDGCVRYLVQSFGIDKNEARSLIRSSK